jgi:hypothetical protein
MLVLRILLFRGFVVFSLRNFLLLHLKVTLFSFFTVLFLY